MTAVPAALAPQPDLRRFKAELMPSWLSVATLLGGHRPTAIEGAVRIAYLGGGSGFTAAVAAAVHPPAAVSWWDPDVRATESARHLRDDAHLPNLTVHERPDLPVDGGGDLLDLIVVDGIVDSAPDQHWYGLVAAIAGSLRPGGTVCISYRNQAGWEEVRPVHHLLRHLIGRDPRPPVEAAEDARRTLRHLQAESAGYIANRPVVSAWVEETLALPAAEIVEQIAQRELRPTSHARLRQVLGRIGCEYVGPALASDLAGPDLSQRLAAIVDGSPSPVVREALTDLALRRTHRADVFRLGAAPLSVADRHKHLDELTIAGTPDLDPSDRSLRSITKVATLRALAHGTVGVRDLADAAADRESMLRRLLASGVVLPVRSGDVAETAGESAARLTTITSRAPVPPAQRVLASPVLASAIPAAGKPTRDQRAALGIR